MFENKRIQGIHISRYIMSWVRQGGELKKESIDDFHNWLSSLGTLTEEEISDIEFIALNGKLELELSAKQYIKNNA